MADPLLFDACDPFQHVVQRLARPGRARTWHEAALREAGLVPFAGVDEAGRGPLAGPVVAAAVVLPDDPRLWARLQRAGVNDSKQLNPERRERLFSKITSHCRVGLAQCSPAEIDRINILQATLTAMRRAVQRLGDPAPRFLLVDGNRAVPSAILQHTLIKGDARSLAIGAASIVAKVARDRWMLERHREHPQYGWDANKGYGTPEHLRALAVYGPCDHHRRSFAPVAGRPSQRALFGE